MDLFRLENRIAQLLPGQQTPWGFDGEGIDEIEALIDPGCILPGKVEPLHDLLHGGRQRIFLSFKGSFEKTIDIPSVGNNPDRPLQLLCNAVRRVARQISAVSIEGGFRNQDQFRLRMLRKGFLPGPDEILNHQEPGNDDVAPVGPVTDGVSDMRRFLVVSAPVDGPLDLSVCRFGCQPQDPPVRTQ